MAGSIDGEGGNGGSVGALQAAGGKASIRVGGAIKEGASQLAQEGDLRLEAKAFQGVLKSSSTRLAAAGSVGLGAVGLLIAGRETASDLAGGGDFAKAISDGATATLFAASTYIGAHGVVGRALP